MSKAAIIQWNVSGDIECPHCGEDNDFLDEDDFWEICQVAEAKTFAKPFDITCKHCKKEISITGYIY